MPGPLGWGPRALSPKRASPPTFRGEKPCPKGLGNNSPGGHRRIFSGPAALSQGPDTAQLWISELELTRKPSGRFHRDMHRSALDKQARLRMDDRCRSERFWANGQAQRLRSWASVKCGPAQFTDVHRLEHAQTVWPSAKKSRRDLPAKSETDSTSKFHLLTMMLRDTQETLFHQATSKMRNTTKGFSHSSPVIWQGPESQMTYFTNQV